MTIYHTYIDNTVELGNSTIAGIQTNGSTYGVGISSNGYFSGIVTATSFVGDGSKLIGITADASGTHLVSYASASDISNSALSIAGISTYNQVGILTGSLAVNDTDYFGISVASSADGKTIIVGAYNDEIGATTSTGIVYVYDRVGSSFNQVGILTGSLATNFLDNFGYSVATSADGKTIIVGAFSDEIGANTSTGVVYVYDRVGDSFNQVGILTGSLAVDASDNFGVSVATSADGKTIVVGAYLDEIGANTSSGVAYVFDQTRETYVYSGPTGNIGIGTTNPTSKLQVVGDVTVTGSVSKGSGSFVIDHPLNETKNLVHSFVEGPRADLIYRGTVSLIDGSATINLDEEYELILGTWKTLCRNPQVWISNIDGWTNCRGTVEDGILTLEAQTASNESVNWLVIAERKDKHMYDTEWTDDNGRPILEPFKT